MTSAAQLEYKAKAKIIKVLAHPSRLFIVDELARGERCVAELTDMIGVDLRSPNSIGAHGLSNHVTLRFGAARQHDVRKHLWDVCRFVSDNPSHTACSDDQYFSHSQAPPAVIISDFRCQWPLMVIKTE